MTVRQARAQQRNARKSTGPRTEEGKKRASRNAIKHGVFCKNVVLPGENQNAFDTLRQHFIDALKPQNAVELMWVERIISNAWITLRLDAAEARCYEFRRAAHENAIKKILDGDMDSDEEFDQWWARLMQCDDVSKDPEYQVFCSVMGQPDMTMNSLMGDLKPQLERYQLMRLRLEQSTHRAMRELRMLRAEMEKIDQLPPGPFSAKASDQLHALAREMGIEDEEEEEVQDEVQDDDAIAQNEPKVEETGATTVTDDGCDDPRAPESTSQPGDMPQNARLHRDVVRRVQDDVAAALLGEHES